MTSKSAYVAGRVSCTLGIISASAGAMKELFGTHVIAPFLPNLDLTRVHEGKALAIGCFLYVAGSWLVRLADPPQNPSAADEDAGITPAQLAAGLPLEALVRHRSAAAANVRDRELE